MSDWWFEPSIMVGVHAGFVVTIASMLTRGTKMDRQTALARIGGTALVLFVIC